MAASSARAAGWVLLVDIDAHGLEAEVAQAFEQLVEPRVVGGAAHDRRSATPLQRDPGKGRPQRGAEPAADDDRVLALACLVQIVHARDRLIGWCEPSSPGRRVPPGDSGQSNSRARARSTASSRASTLSLR